MQSATKYLGGHSDLTAGVVTASNANLAAIRPWRNNLGQMIAPDIAHRLSRSLATLVVRVERHNATAAAIAEMLSQHPKVTRVYYPGLRGSPGHSIAAEQMSGFGGMVTFDIRGTAEEAVRVVDALRLITLAPSLGGAESLITQPATTSHHDMESTERRRRGITDSLVRLSVGLEDANDLMRDLEQALSR
jgi:cystathionine gamma-synthase